jgi:hypothetical protein
MSEKVTAVALNEVFPSYERVLTDWTLFVLLGELDSEESVGDAETALSVQFFPHCDSGSLFAGNSVEESGEQPRSGGGQAKSLRIISLEVCKKLSQAALTQKLMIYPPYKTFELRVALENMRIYIAIHKRRNEMRILGIAPC